MRNLLPIFLGFALAGCGPKPEAKGPAKHYHLIGRVVSVNAKDQTASIDAAAIPDYMEAMTMDYPIANKQEFDTLKAGERIEGTLDVYQSGDYSLAQIKTGAPGKP